jgi:UDPglucose--hexose-1-phosphate uridylyltransferase
VQDQNSRPHRRYNPLTGDWVLVSPHRTQRPWQGGTEAASRERRAAYDPGCYLCPGNGRAAGAVNPPYDATFVFDNDFPAFEKGGPPGALDVAELGAALHGASASPLAPAGRRGEAASPSHDPLLRAEPTLGACRVICFSPRHDLTLAEMDTDAVTAVVDTWSAETAALGETWRWVQVFENKGTAMGCSNPHPHGQIWATSALPTEAAAEDRQQRAYLAAHGAPLLVDYERRERAAGDRVVCGNEGFTALVPFWASWPFETMLLPRRPVARLPDLAPDERRQLAELLGTLLRAYDRLFDVSFPYSFGWHGAPFDTAPDTAGHHWQLHAHIYPPLLRSATVRKYMVGYEMLAEPQRDLTPEQAAARLREKLTP